MTPPRLSPRNGSWPVAANNTTAPQANTSAAAPASVPVSTSGARYVNVPSLPSMAPAPGRPSSITLGPSSASSTLGIEPAMRQPRLVQCAHGRGQRGGQRDQVVLFVRAVQLDRPPQVRTVDVFAHHIGHALVDPDGDHVGQMGQLTRSNRGPPVSPRGTVTAYLRPSSS